MADTSFESHMDDLIARHPKEAQLGGKPGIENKVRAYVDVLFRDDEKRKALHPEVSMAGYFRATLTISPLKGNPFTLKSTSFSAQAIQRKHRNFCRITKTPFPVQTLAFPACSRRTFLILTDEFLRPSSTTCVTTGIIFVIRIQPINTRSPFTRSLVGSTSHARASKSLRRRRIGFGSI